MSGEVVTVNCSTVKVNAVEIKIVETLAGLRNDPKFRLGNHGYTSCQARGKGMLGFISSKMRNRTSTRGNLKTFCGL